MSPPVPSASYTWDDFIALEEDDLRELIDGELVEVEVPTRTHEEIVAWLIYFLRSWARGGPGGCVLGSGYKVRITQRRGVMPDAQYFRPENLPADDQEQGLVRGRPDLVVEVLSPSSRRYDRVIKRQWYADIAVPEYWIVDPAARTVERLVLRDDAYEVADSLSGDAVLRPPTFEGLALPLAEIWG